MADYLANLVNRFNQPEAGVRARPVSRFEPQVNLDLSAWPETGSQNLESQDRFEQPHDLQESANRSDSQQQSSSSGQSDPSRSDIQPRHHPASEQPNNKPPSPLGYLVVQPRWGEDPSVLQPPFSEIIPAPQAGRTRLEAERGADQEEGTPPRGRHATIRPQENRPIPGAQTIIQPQIREAAESPRPLHLHAQTTTEKGAPPAEPVINVTIGRVEVLAVPPTRPAKIEKASRPSPVVSLEEYLKNRDQERQP